MRTWIRNPRAILADETAAGGLIVDGDRIAECLATGAAPGAPCDRTFDASEHVVLPGLVNAHHHFYQTLTRAHGPALDKELFDWLKSLYPVWAGLTPDHLDAASRLALAELLLSGCTTAADHHYVYPEGLEHAVDIQAAAARDLGVRVTLTRGSMNLSVENGGLPPASVVQDAETILADSERVIDAFHEPGEGAFVQIALAPCSPFSVTREIMRDTARLAEDKGVGLHTHLGETEDENAFCEQRFGCRPLDYLEAAGWLTDRVWLAHGIHFTPEEIERLGRGRYGRLPLSGLQHGARLGSLSGHRPGCGRSAGRSGRRRLGVRGCLEPDAGGAAGVAGTAPALRRRPGRAPGRAALGDRRLRGVSRARRYRADRGRQAGRSGPVQAGTSPVFRGRATRLPPSSFAAPIAPTG